ncbi:aminotransferase class I/II-fold pyridoxal phosphate-dependent enzyme [Acetivibrio thermocellus]|uniref:O-acetylhomoserine aminocarboxypropyltransferase/cysteine synthase family protein n=1 Tax=Acetivibrio thermocellus TaxID=1515 RepID=UPI0021AE26FA|nr:aminotransferase class I/II-fold pyridoxal phosphate-dependent enzyme [Acetivibrio thermocellus]UWV46322.1 aminotransferase class I/II-fold pyridoxal phosphate-dependent enzyme [Acetivibrio thermocellus]
MANELEKTAYRFDTQRLRAGYDPKEHNYAVSPPIYQTTSFDFRDVEHAKALFGLRELGNLYTRIGNPTVAVLEQRVAALDGASGAVALASGMAAISYTLLNVAEGGGRILTSPYLYGGSADSFKKVYPKFGITFDFAKNIENPEKLSEEIKPDTKAIYVESISNPNAALLDIDAIAKVAHEHGIPLIVDNTVATPYLYNPISHGADIVVYSATKGLTGHGNVIAGLVLESGKFNWQSDKFPQFSEKYYTLRDINDNYRSFLEVFPEAPFTGRIRFNYLNYFGAALSPFDAYLVLIGLETLSERVEKQVRNASILAEYLKSHKSVEWVRYPGLKDSPYYELAQRDFPKGAGGILSFGFKGTTAQRETFLNSVKLFHYHVNIGDARSLIVNSPQTTHSELEPDEKKFADIPENLIRISAGLEDPADLIADLEQSFEKAYI